MITISAEKFKKDTRSVCFERPTELCFFDDALAGFHQAFAHGNTTLAYSCLKTMDRELSKWEQNKRVVQSGNITRYAHFRDRKGTIYQIRQEINQLLPIMAMRISLLGPIRREADAQNHSPRIRELRDDADESHTHNANIKLHANYMIEKFTFGHANSQNYDAVSYHSSAPFDDVEHWSGSDLGEEQATNVLGAGCVGSQAYAALAYFLGIACNSDASGLDLQHELVEEGNPITVTAQRATLDGLFDAMKSAGYQNLFFRQHCTHESIIDTLYSATPTRPVAVVVGGNTLPYRLVVVTGREAFRDQTVFVCNDGVEPAAAHFPPNGALLQDGTYIHNDTRTTEHLIPAAGLIKLQN